MPLTRQVTATGVIGLPALSAAPDSTLVSPTMTNGKGRSQTPVCPFSHWVPWQRTGLPLGLNGSAVGEMTGMEWEVHCLLSVLQPSKVDIVRGQKRRVG